MFLIQYIALRFYGSIVLGLALSIMSFLNLKQMIIMCIEAQEEVADKLIALMNCEREYCEYDASLLMARRVSLSTKATSYPLRKS